MYGLASVLKQSIMSIYPDCGLRYRSMFHKECHPRGVNSTDSKSKILIMWTRLGSSPKQVEWSPNHFVPCFNFPSLDLNSSILHGEQFPTHRGSTSQNPATTAPGSTSQSQKSAASAVPGSTSQSQKSATTAVPGSTSQSQKSAASAVPGSTSQSQKSATTAVPGSTSQSQRLNISVEGDSTPSTSIKTDTLHTSVSPSGSSSLQRVYKTKDVNMCTILKVGTPKCTPISKCKQRKIPSTTKTGSEGSSQSRDSTTQRLEPSLSTCTGKTTDKTLDKPCLPPSTQVLTCTNFISQSSKSAISVPSFTSLDQRLKTSVEGDSTPSASQSLKTDAFHTSVSPSGSSSLQRVYKTKDVNLCTILKVGTPKRTPISK